MKERTPDEIEFLKGVCLGVLMAGIVVSAIILIRYGTIGRGKGQEGAAALTNQQTMGKLETIQSIIEKNYLNDVDGALLESYMFKGIAAGLDDRYASYYSPEEMEEVSRVNTGSYHGIGVVFMEDPETLACVVMSVYETGPAMRAGVREGDILLRVNGEDVTGLGFADAVSLIRDSDEQVELTFRRGQEEVTLRIDFDEVLLTQVSGEMTADGIGYILIPEFDEVTVSQFEETVDDLKGQGMKSLILDVRNNPGGLLTSVTAMLDDLVGEELLVTTRSRGGSESRISSDKEKIFDGPIAVLTNENSASASEVFAGVLQYYGLGRVVGTTTYGKGVVQSTFTLRDGSAFKLTTEKYYIAGELDIDGVGIQPDIFVEAGLEQARDDAQTPEEQMTADDAGVSEEHEKADETKIQGAGPDEEAADEVLAAAVKLLQAAAADIS